ncbi:MAG: phosphoribosylaminoimidazolesuccinocarboxamide synthase [Desulfococcaceae bacterium]
METVYETSLSGLPAVRRGKVRDLYDLDDHLLMIATDRLSAFDVVMPDPVPGKGELLTQISLFWFEVMRPLAANHLATADVSEYPEVCRPHADILRGRSMLVRKTQVLPVECVVRGYLSGSGWKSYLESGQVCGISLPEGLRESDRLPEPIFTPSTKAEAGAHDVNIDFDATCDLIGADLAARVRDLSLAIYRRGVELADQRGIIIADTKFEFGLVGEELILIDEVLTPDSSRFWPKDTYAPGRAQDSFDKQYVRDYLESVGWNKTPPGPKLPDEVIQGTAAKYREALAKLTQSADGA